MTSTAQVVEFAGSLASRAAALKRLRHANVVLTTYATLEGKAALRIKDIEWEVSIKVIEWGKRTWGPCCGYLTCVCSQTPRWPLVPTTAIFLIRSLPLQALVLDEAHMLKNSASKRFASVASLSVSRYAV